MHVQKLVPALLSYRFKSASLVGPCTWFSSERYALGSRWKNLEHRFSLLSQAALFFPSFHLLFDLTHKWKGTILGGS